MKYSTILSQGCIAGAFAFCSLAAQAEEVNHYNLITNYSAVTRSGEGQDLDSHQAGIGLSEKLEGNRTQYFMLSGNLSDFRSSSSSVNNIATSASYVHMWHEVAQGMSVFGGGFASKNWSNYDVGAAPDGGNFAHGAGVGALAGLTQAVPLSHDIVALGGTTFSLGSNVLSDLPGGNDGINFTASPFVQISYIPQSNMMLYVNGGAMFSNNDVSLSGNNALPHIGGGMNYVINKYTLGINYNHELIDDHEGHRVGVSLARSF